VVVVGGEGEGEGRLVVIVIEVVSSRKEEAEERD